MPSPLDCPGCARRREAMAAMGRRVIDWMKRPTTPPPEIIPAAPSKPNNVAAESLERIRALSRSKGKMENDS